MFQHVQSWFNMFGHVRPCATSLKLSCNVQTAYALIWLGGVPRAHGEDQVHLWIRGHHCAKPTPHEFQPFQPLASSWFLLFAFWTFLCVRKHARRGPRRFSHSFATAWHYLQRPGTRDIDVCPKNSSWGIRVPAAAGRFVITLYQVLQPYHIKALGVLLQYAIGPMGRLSRKRPGGGTAAPQGETARCL